MNIIVTIDHTMQTINTFATGNTLLCSELVKNNTTYEETRNIFSIFSINSEADASELWKTLKKS